MLVNSLVGPDQSTSGAQSGKKLGWKINSRNAREGAIPLREGNGTGPGTRRIRCVLKAVSKPLFMSLTYVEGVRQIWVERVTVTPGAPGSLKEYGQPFEINQQGSW